MQRETPIMRAIRSAITATGKVRWWRNNVGVAKYGGARVAYGLGLGSADLVGFRKGSGRFFCIEAKTEAGELDDDQKRWHASVKADGGFVACCRSVEEALAALDRADRFVLNVATNHFEWTYAS